jgi:hypothetical protein
MQRKLGNLINKEFWIYAAKIFAATIAMAVVAYAALKFTDGRGTIVQMVASVGAGGVVYITALFAL